MRHTFTIVELSLVSVDFFLLDENTSGKIKFLSVLNVNKCFQDYTYYLKAIILRYIFLSL